MKTQPRLMSIGISLWFLTTACLGGSGNSGSESDSNGSSSDVFPSTVAVASPFDVVSTDSSASALTMTSTKSATTGYAPRYAWATGQVDQILNGSTPSQCQFDPELFLTQETNASCFGPNVAYEGHPDYTGAPPPSAQEDGILPPGDVGIWTEIDPTDGHACAAAELNARMKGVQDKSIASLMGLASLVCTANTNGLSLPNNSTLILTTEMNALGISDVTFSSATISHTDASGSNEWSYALDLEYTPGSDTHHIVVEMIHIPSGTPAEFQGRLSYRVNDEDAIGGNCPSTEVTHNGSLLYQSEGFDDIDLEVRGAQFCGHDSDGMTDGLVDPAKKYDPTGEPTGWGNNFNVLTANFDPDTLAGDFAYSWQAGPLDNHTRVFNTHTEEDSSTGIPTGKTFNGYGPDVEGTDGGIDGFICDWTTPNATQTLHDLAQYQAVSFDSSTGKFQSDAENLTYAVTTSCEYDGTGSFTYDSDLDGTVDTDPADPVPNDLLGLTDADGDGVFDEIAASGFALPASPSNL